MRGNIALEKERERERNDLPDVEQSQSYVLQHTLFSALSEKTFATFNTNVNGTNEKERKRERDNLVC